MTSDSRSEPYIGVINAGSSSLKFALFAGETAALHGQVEGIGTHPQIHIAGPASRSLPKFEFGQTPPSTPGEAASSLLSWLHEQTGPRLVAGIGHRVVHGGMRYTKPTLVTPEVIGELEALTSLAPLHQPHNVGPIKSILNLLPDLPQVACFDTAFHRTSPEVAQVYALPAELRDQGIRRYGFHGLSYEYIASTLAEVAPGIADGRVIALHLGNGASACALRSRVSVASTMGFTALDGLPMGTRCGELDAGVALYLLMQQGMSPTQIQDLLYKRSGMLGLSGTSSDFRDLLASDDPRCRFAADVFCYRAARQIGSLAAALGGVDALVFTAGIGEHAAAIRTDICGLSTWLGVQLDEAANARNGPRISGDKSRVQVWVIPTDEELMIARHTRAIVG
jgi:acetate kinase